MPTGHFRPGERHVANAGGRLAPNVLLDRVGQQVQLLGGSPLFETSPRTDDSLSVGRSTQVTRLQDRG
jgi:hypothetical protein